MTSTGESGETGALVHCWWQCKMAQPRGKTVWQMHKKLNHHMIAAVPVLGVYPKELKAETQTDACVPVFIATLFTMTRRWRHSG